MTYSMPRPTKDPADLAAQGHWVDSPVVVLAIEETRDTALEIASGCGCGPKPIVVLWTLSGGRW